MQVGHSKSARSNGKSQSSAAGKTHNETPELDDDDDCVTRWPCKRGLCTIPEHPPHGREAGKFKEREEKEKTRTAG